MASALTSASHHLQTTTDRILITKPNQLGNRLFSANVTIPFRAWEWRRAGTTADLLQKCTQELIISGIEFGSVGMGDLRVRWAAVAFPEFPISAYRALTGGDGLPAEREMPSKS